MLGLKLTANRKKVDLIKIKEFYLVSVVMVAVAVRVEASINLINSSSQACSFSRRPCW